MFNTSQPKVAALIVAGGKGARFDPNHPKQFKSVHGKTLVEHAIAAFYHHPKIQHVCVVLPHAESSCPYQDVFSSLSHTYGGERRQDSVRLGLEYLSQSLDSTYVLIHDAARPFVSSQLIDRVVDALAPGLGVIPTISLRDTVKTIQDHRVITTLSRSQLGAVQTPQGFCLQTLLKLHQRYGEEDFTDDAALYEREGLTVLCVEGEPMNQKITFPSDLPDVPDIRVGQGFDVHAIGPGEGVMLFGIFIPCGFSLIGHSDADVGLHSITDAILGTLCDQDIGAHFSPKDERWRGASSDVFLKDAMGRLSQSQGILRHIDATFMGEAPHISTYREAMRHRVAHITGLDVHRISIKATTTEKLGFCGRKEVVAVLSNVTVLFNNLSSV
jgi:2-C-methyl-D-erythritol 4-phosphate cytidylyltransferase/2-C-methyl-D-erythritol 2,4-cyclodiphosphate synthase